MNDPVYDQLREAGWRRELTPAEAAKLQAYLAAHPEAGADWQDEMELNQLLERLPAAPPASSNFTARVLQAVARETAAAARRPTRFTVWASLWHWLPGAATACLAVGLGVFAFHEHQLNSQALLARNAAEFTDAVSASTPEVMQDFEPIRRMGNASPGADTEILALMK